MRRINMQQEGRKCLLPGPRSRCPLSNSLNFWAASKSISRSEQPAEAVYVGRPPPSGSESSPQSADQARSQVKFDTAGIDDQNTLKLPSNRPFAP